MAGPFILASSRLVEEQKKRGREEDEVENIVRAILPEMTKVVFVFGKKQETSMMKMEPNQ